MTKIETSTHSPLHLWLCDSSKQRPTSMRTIEESLFSHSASCLLSNVLLLSVWRFDWLRRIIIYVCDVWHENVTVINDIKLLNWINKYSHVTAVSSHEAPRDCMCFWQGDSFIKPRDNGGYGSPSNTPSMSEAEAILRRKTSRSHSQRRRGVLPCIVPSPSVALAPATTEWLHHLPLGSGTWRFDAKQETRRS